MYGSYSSSSSSSFSYRSFSPYSSSTTMSAPMDITPSPFSTQAPDATCAFPSWPRRSSLCEYDASEERATSYLSDEDLFPQDLSEDEARSDASHSSGSPSQSPPEPAVTHADMLEMQRQRAAYQREVIRLLLAEEQQRRRQAAKRRSTSSKKSRKTKLAAMTPIAEAE
ncbi:hypothetical protein VTK26DRAFT_570 [Humicola hyalothermophila]